MFKWWCFTTLNNKARIIIYFGWSQACHAWSENTDRDSTKVLEIVKTEVLLLTFLLQVDTILEFSSNQQTKYYALQVMHPHSTTKQLQQCTYKPKLMHLHLGLQLCVHSHQSAYLQHSTSCTITRCCRSWSRWSRPDGRCCQGTSARASRSMSCFT